MEDDLKGKYRYVLDGISQIPSFPSIVSRIISIINSPRAGAEDLVRSLELDVGLSGKVLRLANSAYYGVPGGINSVQRAVVHLGFNAVSSVVLSASVFNLFKNSAGVPAMNRVAFWRHSIETAQYCRVLAGLAQADLDPEIAFTQGMLHDVGALALETAFPKEYAEVIETARKDKRPLQAVEMEHFGMDHSQIGARILERWQIPEIIRLAVLEHHNPEPSGPAREFALVLALANTVSHSRGGLLYPDQFHDGADMEASLAKLGIHEAPPEVLKRFDVELEKAQLVMNMLRS